MMNNKFKLQKITFLQKLLWGAALVLFMALIIANPVNSAIIKSDFDEDTDGWSWSPGTPNSFTWESTGGNPDGYIRFDNNIGPIDDAAIYAPAKFLGNWNELGVERIMYDANIFQPGGYIDQQPYRIQISGPGGSATWYGPDPDPLAGWLTLDASIEESLWDVTSGSWEALISEVTELRIIMAYYTNTSPFEITGVDNVTLSKSWEKAYDRLFYNPSDLSLLRHYRDDFLTQIFQGRLYTKFLYENSKDSLKVLLENPELMAQAKDLIYANILAVDDVIHGQEGIVYNTDEIAAFLDAYAKEAPFRLKLLAKMVKWQMRKKQRNGKLFFGFRLE